MPESSLACTGRLPGQIAYALALLVVALLVTFPIGSYDIFWHLANGREMLSQGRIINEEVFSYTAHGRSFPNRYWVAQIFFHLGYEAGGPTALLAIKALLAAGCAAILYSTGRLLGVRPASASLLTIVAVLVAVERYTMRPEIFSLLGVAALFHLLFRFRCDRMRARWLFVIPPMFALWDFLHGGLFGYLLFAAFVGGETLKYLLRNWRFAPQCKDVLDRRRLQMIWSISLLTLATVTINPHGLLSYGGLLDFVNGKSFMAGNTAEFLPISFAHHVPFAVFFGCALALLLFRVREIDLTQLLLLIIFGAMSIRFRRVTGVCCLIIAPAVAYHGALAEKWLVERCLNQRWGKWVHVGAPPLLLAAAIAAAATFKFAMPGPYAFGVGLSKKSYPIGGARFVREVDLRGNMYNMGYTGGYLAHALGPERKIFSYNLPAIFDDVVSTSHDPAMLDTWKINYGIGVKDFELEFLFRDREEWVLVHWDESSYVVVRNTRENQDLIRRYRLTHLGPDLDSAALKAVAADPTQRPQLLRELAQTLRFHSDAKKAGYLAGWLRSPQSGLTVEAAIDLCDRVLLQNGESPELWEAKGLLLLVESQPAEAAKALDRALAMDGDRIASLSGLAAALLRLAEYDRAQILFNRLIELDPNNAEHHYGFALLHAARGDNAQAREELERALSKQPPPQLRQLITAKLGALPP